MKNQRKKLRGRLVANRTSQAISDQAFTSANRLLLALMGLIIVGWVVYVSNWTTDKGKLELMVTMLIYSVLVPFTLWQIHKSKQDGGCKRFGLLIKALPSWIWGHRSTSITAMLTATAVMWLGFAWLTSNSVPDWYVVLLKDLSIKGLLSNPAGPSFIGSMCLVLVAVPPIGFYLINTQKFKQ